MPKKIKKHPIEMTSDELAAHVFHPKVLKAAKKHISVERAEIASKINPKACQMNHLGQCSRDSSLSQVDNLLIKILQKVLDILANCPHHRAI